MDVRLSPEERDQAFDVDKRGDAQGHSEGLGCGAQEIELPKPRRACTWRAWCSAIRCRLGYPHAHLRPDCPGFRQSHHRELKLHGAHYTAMSSRLRVSTSGQSCPACPANERWAKLSRTWVSTRWRQVLSLPARSRKIDAWPNWRETSHCLTIPTVQVCKQATTFPRSNTTTATKRSAAKTVLPLSQHTDLSPKYTRGLHLHDASRASFPNFANNAPQSVTSSRGNV